MQYCINCGNRLESDDKFCPSCGREIEPEVQPGEPNQYFPPAKTVTPEPTDSQPPEPYNTPAPMPPPGDAPAPPPAPPPMPNPERKKVNKKAIIIIASSCVAVIALAVAAIIYFTIQSNRLNAYEEAVALMDSGKYEDAQEMFVELGSYEDAEELIAECQRRIDYSAATLLMERGSFQEAKSAFEALGPFRDSSELALECQRIMDYDAASLLMKSGNFPGAREAFLALGSYKDSTALAAECQSEIDYATALALMESENYEEAGEIFALLGSFKDSAELAVMCGNWVVYGEALALKNAGNHADALVLFESLAMLGFEDSDAHALESSSILIYAEAEQAYDDELFYTAYKLFMSISSFNDSGSRAELCIQANPVSGQTYRNDDFKGSGVSLRIRTPRDDTRSTFIKIYTEDGTHVSSIFIRGGDSPTVRLPPNTYVIKSGVGVNWFGPEEMFGDENALYQTHTFDDGLPPIRLRSNYNYTLTLRDAVDGNVGTQPVSRDGF